MAHGVYLLDLFLDFKHIQVGWKKEKGFGIAYSDYHCYDEGWEEVFGNIDDVFGRVIFLLGQK